MNEKQVIAIQDRVDGAILDCLCEIVDMQPWCVESTGEVRDYIMMMIERDGIGKESELYPDFEDDGWIEGEVTC